MRNLPASLVRLVPSLLLLVAGCGGDPPATMGDMSTCTAPQVFCGFSCSNPMTDSGNCGRCGKSCLATEHCAAGVCVSDKCGIGKTECGENVCADLMTDAAHCGACNQACAVGQPCLAGKCGMACAPPQIPCNGTCVDGQTDPKNCGTCGTVCRSGENCFHGACKLDICGTRLLGMPGPALVYTGGPSDLASGDFDKDKDTDLVIMGTTDVILLVNNENDHSFVRMNLMAKNALTRPVVADFNGDGNMDIAAMEAAGKQALILRGDGKATFAPSGVVPAGAGPYFLFGDDLNKDLKPDLVMVSISDGAATVALNAGAGMWKPGIPVPMEASMRSVVAGDINGDGRADLVSIDGMGVVSLRLTLGDGTYNLPLAVNVPFPARVIGVGDLDGNSKQDLVVAGDTQTVVMLNLGNNPFPELKSGPVVTTPAAPTTVMVVDADADGKLDAVLGRDTVGRADGGAVFVLRGDGAGMLAADRGWLEETAIASLLAADFDGDGKLDFAFGQRGHDYAVGILHGMGMARFALPLVTTGNADITQLAGGDLDGDRAAELIVATDKLHVWKNDGFGKFTKGDPLDVAAWVAVSVLDVDGDKKNDVVVYDGKTTLAVFVNPGDGKFGKPITLTSYANAPYLTFGDVDADMKPDLVQLGVNGVLVHKNLGKGMFDSPMTFKATHTGPAVVGDFNNDSWPDVAVVDSPTSFAVLVNKTLGALGPPVSYPAGMNNVTIVAGELDGDGKLDLVLASKLKMGGGLISIVINDGDATFKPAMELGYPFAVPAVAVGDLDGDRRPELIGTLGGPEVRGLGVMRNVKNRLQPLAIYPGVLAGVLPILADGDGDGRLDVISAVSSPGGQSPQSINVALSACLP